MANIRQRINVINSNELAIASLPKHPLVTGSFQKGALSSRSEDKCELMTSATLARCPPCSELRYRNRYLQALSQGFGHT